MKWLVRLYLAILFALLLAGMAGATHGATVDDGDYVYSGR